MVQRLEKHTHIALDFDETLVEHEKSPLLWEFVKTNLGKKKFYIITFRSDADSLKHKIEEHILDMAGDNLKLDWFEGIWNVPEELYNDFRAVQELKQLNGIEEAKLYPEEINFYKWKGLQAKTLGCTILVDDRPGWVKKGVLDAGLEFIDTATLI